MMVEKDMRLLRRVEMKWKREEISGEEFENHYDSDNKTVNVQLIKVINEPSGNEYFEIHLQSYQKENKNVVKAKTLLKLHIKDAIRLKSIIDTFVYESMENWIEEART